MYQWTMASSPFMRVQSQYQKMGDAAKSANGPGDNGVAILERDGLIPVPLQRARSP